MPILIAILGLGLLILIHELGHFLTAKAFGMRAEKFYLGFPPAAVKKKMGETEYGIGWVPLGGYVKITGMTRDEDIPEDVKSRAFYAQPLWQKVIVISAGALMNVLLALVFFFVVYWQASPAFEPTPVIFGVIEEGPAMRAGIIPGDRLLQVEGVASDDIDVLRPEILSRPDAPVTVVVERKQLRLGRFFGMNPSLFEKQPLSLNVNLQRNEETGEGQIGVRFDSVQVGVLDIPASEALRHSASQIRFFTTEVFIIIKSLIVSSESRGDITSPIGIVTISAQVIKLGWASYVFLLGFISLQLAILNLLPLLPLDGGQVLINILERIKGSPIRRDILERVSFIGIILFVMLLGLGLFNDIQRYFGEGFQITP